MVGVVGGVTPEQQQIINLLSTIDGRLLDAFHYVVAEIAALSERVEQCEGSRDQWEDLMAARGIVDPEAADSDVFTRMIYEAFAPASGNEVASVTATLAYSAAADRAELRQRIEALEAGRLPVDDLDVVADRIDTIAAKVDYAASLLDGYLSDDEEASPALR